MSLVALTGRLSPAAPANSSEASPSRSNEGLRNGSTELHLHIGAGYKFHRGSGRRVDGVCCVGILSKRGTRIGR